MSVSSAFLLQLLFGSPGELDAPKRGLRGFISNRGSGNMVDETLQAAFEIKTACDEISRKLLRWHWENKPGEHSLGALLDHIRTRQQESPEYYDRLPDLAGRNSWQQIGRAHV